MDSPDTTATSSARSLAAAGQRAPIRRILTILLVLAAISSALHLYLVSRLASLPAWRAPWGGILRTVLWCGAALVPVALVAWHVAGRARVKALTWVGLTWLGAVYYLVMTLAVAELPRLAVPASAEPLFSRVAALVAVAVSAVATTVGLRTVRRGPVLARVDVPVPGLAPALDGLRIAHLSDIHVGPTIDGAQLADIVRRVAAEAPDLVCITGDLVDGTVAEIGHEVVVLGDLHPPLGVFFTTGNHEYYSGHDEWLAHLTRLGLGVLQNSRVRVVHGGQPLDVVGIPDTQGARFGERPDLAAARAGHDDAPWILLAHQPKQAVAAAADGAALVLSGHTHAGQMWPFSYFAMIGQPSIRGLHRIGATALYTSEGTGYWGPPLRVRTRSEIAILTLRASA